MCGCLREQTNSLSRIPKVTVGRKEKSIKCFLRKGSNLHRTSQVPRTDMILEYQIDKYAGDDGWDRSSCFLSSGRTKNNWRTRRRIIENDRTFEILTGT